MIFMRIISFFHPCKYVLPLLLLVALLASPSLMAQWVPLNPVTSVDPQPDGLVLVLQSGFLRFSPQKPIKLSSTPERSSQ
jgi:hypothetical protein